MTMIKKKKKNSLYSWWFLIVFFLYIFLAIFKKSFSLMNVVQLSTKL